MLENKEETLKCLDKIIREYTEEFFIQNVNCENNCEDVKNNSEYFSAYCKSSSTQLQNGSKLCKEELKQRINVLNGLMEFVEDQENEKLADTSLENSQKVRYSILDVLELDRKRIARDLHDSSVQILTMLVHKAELCEKLIEIDQNRTKMELQLMRDVLKDAITELRQTIYNLRPMTMDDLGLMDSVERHIQMLLQSSEIDFKLSVDNKDNIDIEKYLKSVEKLSIFRILQECCSNIVKHSKASHALIKLKVDRECLELIVEDNGIGFSGEKAKLAELAATLRKEAEDESGLNKVLYNRNDCSGFGLSMLYERVYLLNGSVQIDTSSKGTAIDIKIPIIIL